VKGLADVQQRYLEWIGSQRSMNGWSVAVIEKLWDLVWDMWDHHNQVLHYKDQSTVTIETYNKILAEFILGKTELSRSTNLLYCQGQVHVLNRVLAVKQACVVVE
jgi:hypothetical protein